MISVLDVAKYILRKQGPMDALKLQKLVYYAQAWSLVWDEAPLFRERIEAWTFGPVVPRLYEEHRGKLTVRAEDIPGDLRRLSSIQRETIDAVLASYGQKPAQWLSELTHREPPWRDARCGLPAKAPSTQTIGHVAMRDYYGSLTTADATRVKDMDE